MENKIFVYLAILLCFLMSVANAYNLYRINTLFASDIYISLISDTILLNFGMGLILLLLSILILRQAKE